MNAVTRFIQRLLVRVGNMLTAIGCLGLFFGAIGIIEPDQFAIGISSGVRVIGSVAIAGCLLSVIGYGLLDIQDQEQHKESKD